MSETKQNDVDVDVQINQAHRETFEQEWSRLSMPGYPERTTLDRLPLCGRFVKVTDSDSGGYEEYELDLAVRVLRDFHDTEGRTDMGERAIKKALASAGATC